MSGSVSLGIIVEILDKGSDKYGENCRLKTIHCLPGNNACYNPLGELWTSHVIIDQSMFDWTYLKGQDRSNSMSDGEFKLIYFIGGMFYGLFIRHMMSWDMLYTGEFFYKAFTWDEKMMFWTAVIILGWLAAPIFFICQIAITFQKMFKLLIKHWNDKP